ncbi:hypothetical protein BDV32DRAFT_156131 [Aspergillus pseudonomiae]|nr:hypothetical protein BDV32DRAFT_156131 [Aspergillus pseudonomiae]
MSTIEGHRVNCQTPSDAYSQDIGLIKIGDIESNPFVFLHLKDTGKPSKIQTLCKDAVERGNEQCIWVCYNRGAKNLARDVPILPGELLEAHNFERMFGWWRRLLLRGPIKIQLVKVRRAKVLPIN